MLLLETMKDRRRLVPFDPDYFKKRGPDASIRETFTHIYTTDLWSGGDSISGAGAGRDQTKTIEAELPELLQELNVDALLDLPCGDFSWMRHVDLPVRSYIGADIVPELVARNHQSYGSESHRFVALDLTADRLPQADLLLCRDGLVHLSFDDIFAALRNVLESEIEFILTTTFPDCTENVNIETGDWRLLNLELPPFNLPRPRRLINEGCTEADGAYRDKSLGLWRVEDLEAAGPWAD